MSTKPANLLMIQLQQALAENERLRGENAKLHADNNRLRAQNTELRKETTVIPQGHPAPGMQRGGYSEAHPSSKPELSAEPVPEPVPEATPQPSQPPVTNTSPAQAKVALFRRLFRGRDDVYAVRWEDRAGNKSGYSPACGNEWNRPICPKPRVKCADCEHRQLLPMTDEVIHDHLSGRRTIGGYPLLSDETCWFLAIDFDRAAWREDASAILDAAGEMQVPASLERSRSGNGGHVWVFFAEPVPAALARKLGSALITRAMERRHQVGLDSYDRLFPNQDTLPKGGFGNLIALPLQKKPRDRGNSVFLDRDFHPLADQWAFLSSVRRMTSTEVDEVILGAARSGSIIGVRASLTDEAADEDPWLLPPSGSRLAGPRPDDLPFKDPLPTEVNVILNNLAYIPKEGLPPAMLNRLIRLAAFQNPEFYKAQAMRLSTFGKPRVIGCAEDFPRFIGLPRGCLEEAVDLFAAHGVRAMVTDERFAGRPIEATFRGELTPAQREATSALLKHEIGILSAATGFGKTIVAASLIAERGVNTLVLVHRRQLMDQWRERLSAFLDAPAKSIGQVGGGRMSPTGVIDIGIIQSLNRKGVVADLVADYGHVVVDECHHLSAFSFEQVLKKVKARYVTGLTATPFRQDGHHPIIMMQCGPIRFRVNPKDHAALESFTRQVVPRHTGFKLPPEVGQPGIQDLYSALVRDRDRNDLIFSDLLDALRNGRSPLLLTERTEHLDEFARRFREVTHNVIVLRGGVGKKKRQAIAEALAGIPEGAQRVIIATGRYAGEGFDDARLDTLFLALPISWRGTLQQYAGRLHRAHGNKRMVQIYDYVDVQVPVLVRMYERRLKGYRAMGYHLAP